MGCKLFKIRCDSTEGKFFFVFYLCFESGVVTKINRNEYKDKEGYYHSNYTILCALAKEVKDINEIKYE